MKHLILIFFLIPFVLFGQELTFDSTAIIQVDTNYFLETHLIYDNGNQSVSREIIGDSLQLIDYLFIGIEQQQRQKAIAFKIAFDNRFLGEAGRAIKDHTGVWYYKHTADRLFQNFLGSYTIKISSTTYDAVATKPAALIKFDIETVGIYTLLAESRKSFTIKDFNGTGLDEYFFLIIEDGIKRVFVNDDNSVRIVFIGD